MLSSRNIINAKIFDVKKSDVVSLIYAKLENNKTFKALITTDSANDLQLKANDDVVMVFKAGSVIRTSSANELNGIVKHINKGSVYVIIDVDCNGVLIAASITMESFTKMQLEINDNVNVLIKATNVMVGIKE